MELFKAIIGFLIALPDLMKVATYLIRWLDRSSRGDIARFSEEAALAFKKLDGAKSKDEKSEAAKAIANLISNIYE